MPSDDVFATVRSVQPDSTGHVKIAYDETRRREVTGKMDDQAILRLMLAAAHEDNAAVRVESVELLKGRAASSEVRDALLNVVATRFQSGRAAEGPGWVERAGCGCTGTENSFGGAADG